MRVLRSDDLLNQKRGQRLAVVALINGNRLDKACRPAMLTFNSSL